MLSPVHAEATTNEHEFCDEQHARGCGQGFVGVHVVKTPWKMRVPVHALWVVRVHTPIVLQQAPSADTASVNTPGLTVRGEKLPTRMRYGVPDASVAVRFSCPYTVDVEQLSSAQPPVICVLQLVHTDTVVSHTGLPQVLIK